MELTYQSPMMPAAYAVISADEMTYIDGGALQIGSYLIEFHPENLLTAAVNFTVNFAQLMGKAALTAAVGGLLLMHEAVSQAGTASSRASRSITRQSPSTSS